MTSSTGSERLPHVGRQSAAMTAAGDPVTWLAEKELETDGERITSTTKILLFLTKAQGLKAAEIFPQQRSGTFGLLRSSKSAFMGLPQSPGILSSNNQNTVYSSQALRYGEKEALSSGWPLPMKPIHFTFTVTGKNMIISKTRSIDIPEICNKELAHEEPFIVEMNGSSSEFTAPLHGPVHCLEGFVCKALFAAAFGCECDLWCCSPWQDLEIVELSAVPHRAPSLLFNPMKVQTNMGNKNGNAFQIYFWMLVKYRHKRCR
ncbi:hypothetical protein EK904_002802, partial [Melospiza melodia maxima]